MTESEARAIAAPQQPGMDWPLSEEARKWVQSVKDANHRTCNSVAKRLATQLGDQFNRAEHERFMKSLG